MNDLSEPRRLFESDVAPAGLRALLEQAHADIPTEATVQQLVQASELRAQVETPSLGQGGSWVGRHSGKLVLVAVLAGVGTWYGATRRNVDHPAPSPAAMIRPTMSVRPQVVPVAPEEPSTSIHNEAPVKAPLPSVTKPLSRSRARAVHPGRTAKATPVLPETNTVVAIGTDVGMGSADEYRLLRSARQALASDPTKALDLTQEHIRRFPQGMLTQEREAIAVEALVHLNRHVQAKTRGQAFLAAYPVSPYRSRVEHALSRLAGAAPKP